MFHNSISGWHRKAQFIFALTISANLALAADAQVRRTAAVVPAAQKLTVAPATFPVPIYNQNIISTEFTQGKMPTSKSATITAVTKTGDDPRLPFEWYQNVLNRQGWSVALPNTDASSPLQRSGGLLMLRANKDDYNLLIVCVRTQRFPYTTISVSAVQNK